jgi:hypothetical protein
VVVGGKREYDLPLPQSALAAGDELGPERCIVNERQFDYSNLPPELTTRPRWLVWRFQQRAGKATKVPFQCSGRSASVSNPRHYSSFVYAFEVWRLQHFPCDGLGFVFTPELGLCGLDVDGCYPSDAAEIAPWAASFEQRFSNTFHESSPSEAGIKFWLKAKAPRCGKWDVGSGKVEIYDHGRFFTVTGWADNSIPRVITDHQRDIELLVANLDRLRGREHTRTPASPQSGIPALIPQGERHKSLLRIAGWLWHRGLDPEEIAAALHTFNSRRCYPPHTPEHIDQIIRSMERSWAR